MKSLFRLQLAAGTALVTAALAVVPTVAGAASSAPYCGITWGSVAKSASTMTRAPVTGVRVGRHDCYDRMVIDLAGTPAPGYTVRYIDPPYRAEGSGAPLLVAGGAVLQITVRAPAYDDAGHPTAPWSGTDVVSPAELSADGYRTFRDVVYGGSFEGYSSFGLGVRARLPFRVLQLTGSRLVIDVAHQW